jgi:hypothetical protein
MPGERMADEYAERIQAIRMPISKELIQLLAAYLGILGFAISNLGPLVHWTSDLLNNIQDYYALARSFVVPLFPDFLPHGFYDYYVFGVIWVWLVDRANQGAFARNIHAVETRMNRAHRAMAEAQGVSTYRYDVAIQTQEMLAAMRRRPLLFGTPMRFFSALFWPLQVFNYLKGLARRKARLARMVENIENLERAHEQAESPAPWVPLYLEDARQVVASIRPRQIIFDRLLMFNWLALFTTLFVATALASELFQ